MSRDKFTRSQRQEIKAKQNNTCAVTGKTTVRLEVHHKIPKYRGGNGDTKNGVAVSLPGHASIHFQRCVTPGATDKRFKVDRWATKAIVGRMDIEEMDEFIKIIKR